MKKFLYSNILKLTAVIIICALVGAAAFAAMSCGLKYNIEYVYIYNSEYDLKRTMRTVIGELPYDAEFGEMQYKILMRDLAGFGDMINYYIDIPEKNIALSNCDDLSVYEKSEYHYITDTVSNPQVYDNTVSGSRESEELTSNARIYLAVKNEYVEKHNQQKEEALAALKKLVYIVSEMFLAAIILLIYLLAVCGRKEKGGKVNIIWMDKMYAEFNILLIFALFCIGVVPVDFYLSDAESLKEFFQLIAAFEAVLSAAVLALLLSLVRQIKNRSVRSIIFSVCKKLISLAKTFMRQTVRLLSDKSGALAAAALLIYTAAIGLCGMKFVFGGVIIFAFALFIIGTRSKELEKIKQVTKDIKDGILTSKVPPLKSEDYRAFAENINVIGDGLSKALDEQMKSERMKTELITNVSHDLKTPLTSIISYSKLLEDMELMPEEARDYVKIISKKSDRLKALTSDLFDISKAQSGSDEISPEKLNASELIAQSMGELDGEIKKSELEFLVKADENLFFTADGKKMSRVMSNLILNAVKYSLKGTRVYINASEKDNKILLEIKNISAYPLDFDTDEITERFVRGDKSRSEEGNGLGLAIAKTYTELCGGSFKITTDGDLFKASLLFERFV